MSDPSPETPMRGCLFRIFWAMVGPGMIVVAALTIAANKIPPGSVADFIFGGAVLASLLARYFDPGLPSGSKAEGEDIGTVGKTRYTLLTLGAAALLYAFAHFVGPKLL